MKLLRTAAAASAALVFFSIGLPARSANTAGDAYVYVSDAYSSSVFVYSAQRHSGRLALRSQTFPATPTGMTTDRQGRVYLAEGGDVLIYSPGLGAQVGAVYGAANGFTSARDVAVNAEGDIFVSCLSVRGPGVFMVPARRDRAQRWFPAPTSQLYGVLLSPDENHVLLDLGFYGTAVDFALHGTAPFTIAARNGAPSPGGLAWFGSSLVMTGGTGLWEYAPSAPGSQVPWTLASSVDFGLGHATGYPATGSDGSLYVPVHDENNRRSHIHEVRIYAKTSDMHFARYTTIESGLRTPVGVAVGTN